MSVTASSEEADKGNVAQNAFDGRADTRWCASNGELGQWLRIDLGEARPLAHAEVKWEFPGKPYGFVLECSRDGRSWDAPLTNDLVRFVRLAVTNLPDGTWASVREVELFDHEGRLIENQAIRTSGRSCDIGYDDSGWRQLAVPHDWGIEGPFREDLPNSTGKLPWPAIGWHRKHFTIPAEDSGQRLFIDFDGVMANAEVWLNGHHVGGWPYGYNAFRLELTPYLNFGGENVIAVRADTLNWGSRWYPGAGIYRDVWLVKTSPLHVSQWGVYVTTPSISAERGEVKLAVTVDNQTTAAVNASLQAEIFEMGANGLVGRAVSRSEAVAAAMSANSPAQVQLSSVVLHPQRWDIHSPRLYLARVTLRANDQVTDVYEQPFGFRTIEFNANEGFKLNGRRVALQGVCLHHDLGPLGAAFNRRAAERQLEILKEMGCNAIRTAHNPPAPEVLDLCDRMGFVVVCEAFDCWKQGKAGNDYARLFDEWHERDLRAMVRRERNHPSVILWSIGNEVREQDGPRLAGLLADIVRAEDPTRPVTAGANQANAGINGFQNAVDVFGLNYNINEYRRLLDHPGNGDKPFLSSESASCISSRGEYFFPVARGEASRFNFQVSSYDVDAPSWGQSPDDAFAALDRHPRFMGEFVWTGFDYLGEPTPYDANLSNLLNFTDPEKRAAMQRELEALGKIRVPSASSYFGILDLCGFKKDRFYIYQARWRPDFPMAHILPHWNWPERIGQVTPVHVYTSGDEAELFLNGQSLGRKSKGQYEYRLRWDDVFYQPGDLKVVAYRAGKPWATDIVKTTGKASQILLEADRKEIVADGKDLAFVTVRIADAEGLTVPRSNPLVTFELSGPGEIVAVGNGDATSHEPFQARQRRAFNGLCQVIVRAQPGRLGPFSLKAASEGLSSGTVTISSR